VLTPEDIGVSEINGCTYILGEEPCRHELLIGAWRVRGTNRVHPLRPGSQAMPLPQIGFIV
jgi:hypothetical protein